MSWKDDFNFGLAAFGVKLPERLPTGAVADIMDHSPLASTAAVVGASTALFYALERGRNPKVKDVFDAMVYTSTCLSVGYGDIFAKTPLGKMLGSALMTVGPALATRTLDGPAMERRDAVQGQVLETLKRILKKLEPAQSSDPPTHRPSLSPGMVWRGDPAANMDKPVESRDDEKRPPGPDDAG